MNDRGLSRLQRDILCAVWRVYQTQAARDSKTLIHWGVKWSGRHAEVTRRDQSRAGRGQSARQRAADSRALRRLEARWLVVRKNSISGSGKRYTDYVWLTDEGKAVAQRLTSDATV